MTPSAIITGAARGLGAALSERFGAAGYRIALVGRDGSALSAQRERLTTLGYESQCYVCDVSVWADVEATFTSIDERMGEVRLLVNNAGGWLSGPIDAVDPEALANLSSATILGTMFCSKAALPAMRRSGSGFILNIGSTSGLASSRDTAASSAPKAAVSLFTHTFAREVAGDGIRVAVIQPSRVKDDESAESADGAGNFERVSTRQVAEIAAFVVGQPQNVTISEIIVSPSNLPI